MSSHCRKVEVTEQTSGRRADAWLSQRFRQWSRSQMAREIQAGRVRSSRRELKPSTVLQVGEILEITIPGIGPRTEPPPVPPVIYEDARLLVLNKPPGFLCHPAGDRWEWGIIGRVRESRPDTRVELAHRLDRETSGILVLTKDLEANIFLKDQLRKRTKTLQKDYLAIVHGSPEWRETEVVAPITEHIESEVRLRRGVRQGGLEAKTGFTMRQRLIDDHCSLLKVLC